MILSLSTPKRRAVTSDGTIFFNDFNNTLHVDLHGVQEPVALNLGTSNWTVSDRGEVAFLFRNEGSLCLAIADPARRTRVIHRLQKHKLLDLLLLDDRFVAAIPGYLLLGQREENGALSWRRMRALDCGAGFRFRLEDDGRLSYTKRGSCLRFFVHPDSRDTASVFEPELLWTTLFRGAFAPGFLPALPKQFSFTPSALLDQFSAAAAHHTVSDAGMRLYALLSMLEREGSADPDTLTGLVALDWELQYGGGLNEPFPSAKLLDTAFRSPSPAQLRPDRLVQAQLLKWSRKFEDASPAGKWAKPLNKVPYTDIPAED